MPINISWDNPNAYQTQPAIKQKVETTVKNAPQTTNAINKGASSAVIRSTIHKSPGGADNKDHVTVDYKKSDGKHLTTKHVYT